MAVDTAAVKTLATVAPSLTVTIKAWLVATTAGMPLLPVSLLTTATNHRINTVADLITDSATTMMVTMVETVGISTATARLATLVALSARASLTMDVLPMCTEASMVLKD